MLITILALAAFLTTAFAAGAAIIYAVRAGIQARRSVIEMLSLSGATDASIAGLFQQRYALLALIAGAAGAVSAIALLSLLRFIGGSDGLTPALPVAWIDILMLSPCPLVAATVALVAAHLSARSEMARLGASQADG